VVITGARPVAIADIAGGGLARLLEWQERTDSPSESPRVKYLGWQRRVVRWERDGGEGKEGRGEWTRRGGES
jgi:hypothetical protein